MCSASVVMEEAPAIAFSRGSPPLQLDMFPPYQLHPTHDAWGSATRAVNRASQQGIACRTVCMSQLFESKHC